MNQNLCVQYFLEVYVPSVMLLFIASRDALLRMLYINGHFQFFMYLVQKKGHLQKVPAQIFIQYMLVEYFGDADDKNKACMTINAHL